MKSIAFTGHRDIYYYDIAEICLKEAINIYSLIGFTDYYTGGAMGFDTLAAEAVIRKKKKDGSIRLHLILPCAKEFQTKGWSKDNIRRYDDILKNADTVTYITEEYYNGCMNVRNKKLVDSADVVICWLEAGEKPSGTKIP